MRQWFMVATAAVALAGAHVGRAGDLGINIIVSGQVAPGVYGQVQLGNAARPPLVYAQPMLIEPQAAPPPPVYLHVPPDHARNWRKHCREYNACNRPVYFIKSQEYEPEYQRHYQEHEREREMERQRFEERERQDRGHGHEQDHGHGHDDHGHGHDDHDKHDGN